MSALLLALTLALAPVPLDEAGWVDVPPAPPPICASLVKKAKRGAVWRQVGLTVAVAMANTHTSYASSTIRANGQTYHASGSVTYSDTRTANEQLNRLTPYAKRLSKKMVAEFAAAGCDQQLYYGAN